MGVDTNFASLFESLKLEDPWLPPRPWESIPSETGVLSHSVASISPSKGLYDTSAVSEASLVRLAMNALQGMETSLMSIDKLCAAFCSDPADRTFHRIPSLWNRSLSTVALGKILKSIGCLGCEVFLLRKFVDYFTNLNLGEMSRGNEQAKSDSEEARNYPDREGRECPPYSLVNHAFAIAVGKVLEGYFCSLGTLYSSVGLRRSPKIGDASSCSDIKVGCLTSVGHEFTLLEIYLHTKGLRTQIEALGYVCNVHNVALCFSESPFENLGTTRNFNSYPRGGDLLTYLYTQLKVADTGHSALLKFLFLRSCEPYFGFIRSWIFKAKISDPYNEFIVTNADKIPSSSLAANGIIVDIPSAIISEREGVAFPCFLRDLLTPLCRAGQQLQVLIKLLELSDDGGSWNHNYEDFLPYWSRMPSDSLSQTSSLAFDKEDIEATVSARNNYYKYMMEKLGQPLTNLEFRYQQAIPHCTVPFPVHNSKRSMPQSFAANNDLVSPSTKKRNQNLSIGTVESDLSSMMVEFPCLEEPLESSECSSFPCSEEDEEEYAEELSERLSGLPDDTVAQEQKYFSALSFFSSTSADISLQKPSQRYKSCTLKSDLCETSKKTYLLGYFLHPRDEETKLDRNLLRTSEAEDLNNQHEMSWPIGCLLKNPFCVDRGKVDDMRLHVSDCGLKASSIYSGVQADCTSHSSDLIFSENVLTKVAASKDQYPIGNSFSLKPWKVKYHPDILSANPMLTKNSLVHLTSKLGERFNPEYAKFVPSIDFISVKNPLKVYVNRLAVSPTQLGNELSVSAGSHASAAVSMNSFHDKEGYSIEKVSTEKTRSSCVYSPPDVEANVSGGSGWEILLGSSGNTANVSAREQRKSARLEIPLDYIIEKCLLEEIQLQYKYVSKLTIKLLEEGFHLQEHLLALRRYHLMESADWADLFILSLQRHKWYVTEVDKRISEIQGLLELSVQRSSCEIDQSKDRLYVYMKEQSAVPIPASSTGIHSFDALGLGYRVDWPVSIVLTPVALKIYAEIFSFLIQVKLAVSSLSEVWCSLKELKHLKYQTPCSELHDSEACRFNILMRLRQQVYHFVTTLQQYVLHGHLRSPSSNDVVFGKETSIELVVIDDDGVVQSICEQPVFGTIKDLAILPWNERFHSQRPQMQGKDLLIVLSDSGKLSFLTFSNEMHRFFPLTQTLLAPVPGNLKPQIGWMLAVDSNGCFIAASTHVDQLIMFSVSHYPGTDIIDKRLKYPAGDGKLHGTIWSMCFISKDIRLPSKEHNPVLAILLNRRGSLLNELLLMEWDTRENVVHVISQYAEAGPLAHNIVEVPHSYGFAFLFRVGDALLMDLRDAHNPCCVYRTSLVFLPTVVEEQNFVEESYRVNDVDEEGNIFNVAASALLELRDMIKNDDPMNIDNDSVYLKSTSNRVCSWSWEPQNKENPRMIFCVDSGEVFMIEISSDSTGLKVNLSDCLYKGLPFKELLWVEGGYLVALVEMGDGMVLKVEEGKLLYKSPVQNIAPILDMSVVDYNEEKHEQMFACCGMAPEGSLRIIRNGICVEKLLKTAPIYQGITGTWTVKMKVTDRYHSFLVLSFVEETRVLSVGVSFTDVTDLVGFQPDVCTLACGLIGDGLLVQIHQNAVTLCLPTKVAHPEGIPFPSPICTSWFPDNMSISLGAVGHNLIVVATSNPCSLFVLGVRSLSSFQYEIYQMQHARLQNELSCISIPQRHFRQKPSSSHSSSTDSILVAALPGGVEIGNTIVIGTHMPSVEVLSFIPDKGIRVLAIGTISLINSMGTTISGSVPQDVRLVQVDRLYLLSGLRNGMLLRFEWPSVLTIPTLEQASMRPYHGAANAFAAAPIHHASPTCLSTLSDKTKDIPVHLQLIAIRRIGITPAFLVPLNDFLDADIIALSDRPWLMQTARHSLSYTSISFQSSTNATPVCSRECPKGILFVAENSLHLVEMVHSKRLNVQKFHLGGTPRKVLFHRESRLLFVMRTELSNDSYSSDICCVDPLSGSILSSFKLDPGETGKCMELVKVGNDQVLVVGTSLSAGPAIMPSGEAESTRGRLLVLCIEHKQNSDSGSITFCSKAASSQRTSPFREIIGYAAEQLSSSSLCSSPDDNSSDGIKLEETEAWILRLSYSTIWPGMVVAICPYLDRYFLASAGNSFYVCGFPNDNSQRVKRLAVGRTRFMIMTLTAHFTRIAVGDCRDGILFFSYHEDSKKLEQLYSDPVRRLVADCMLMDVDTAVVSDRRGSIAVLSCSHHLEDNASPECNLKLSSSYYMGEIAMSIRKGSFSYKLPADDVLRGCDVGSAITDLSQSSIVASTLLGSIIIFIPISRDEYELLEAVQARLVVHPLTSPVLGNDHNEFRGRESRANVPKILDGDMLAQFLELTSFQQEAVLALPLGSPNTVMLSNSKPSLSPITVNQVVRLLERVHYALN